MQQILNMLAASGQPATPEAALAIQRQYLLQQVRLIPSVFEPD